MLPEPTSMGVSLGVCIKSFIGGAYTGTLLKFEQRWLDAVNIERQWLVGDSHVLAASAFWSITNLRLRS
jgi:hypothetical protein